MRLVSKFDVSAAVDAELSAAGDAHAHGNASAAVAHCQRVFELTTEPEALADAALLVHGVGGELNAVTAGLCDRALAALPSSATTPRAAPPRRVEPGVA